MDKTLKVDDVRGMIRRNVTISIFLKFGNGIDDEK
jgi:hypothetical protein